MKTYLNFLVVMTALLGFSIQGSGYNLDFRVTDESVFQPVPQPSFGRDGSTSGGYIFFDRTSKQETAFQNLKGLLGDLDRDYFSNCATTSAKCRFIDESNRNNHLAKIKQEAQERAAKHLAKKQKGIEDLKADAVRVKNGQTPVQADLKASIDRAIAELKQKADRSVAESQEAQKQNETVKIPQAKSDMEKYIGLKDSLNRQLDESKTEAREHAEASKVELENEASSISNGPIHRLADEERVEDAFSFQDDFGSSFIRKEYASDNIDGELQGRGQAYMSEGLVAQGRRLMERANTYRNYQNGNSLPYQGTRLSDKAKQDFAVGDLKSDSFVGYENIRLLNAYSAIPPEQLDDGLNMQFGLLAQSLVDTSPTANIVGYLIKLEQAWGIIDFAVGVASGVYESGKGTVTGLYQVVSSPLATARGIKYAILNYEKTWDALTTAIEKNLNTLNNCGEDTRACGEVVGYIAGEVAQSLVGGVALKAASKAVKAEKVGLAVKEVVKNTVGSAKKIGLNTAEDFSLLKIELKATTEVSGGAFDAAGKLPRNGSRTVLFQGSTPTCGPTSCAMVLDTFGKPKNLAEVVGKFQVRSDGITLPEIRQFLNESGIPTEIARLDVTGLKSATSNGSPAIAAVYRFEPRTGLRQGHAIVVDGVTTRYGQEVVAIRDPWGTQYFQKVEDFMKEYSGIALPTKGILP